MNSNNFDKEKIITLNLFKQKKFYDVIKRCSKLYKKNPNDAQLLYWLGLASINIKNFLNAEKYFEKLISIKKTSEFFYTLGNIQKKIKKYTSAINSFESAIKINPNFSEAYNNLGNTKKLLKKNNEAILDYKKAISLKSDNIEALFNLSTILKDYDKYQDLIPIYNRILRLDKNNIKTIYNLGSAYLFLGNIQKGRDCFEKAIRLNKFHIPSLRNYISITKIDNKNKIFKILQDINQDQLTIHDKILALNALSKGYFDQNNIAFGFKLLEKSNKLKQTISKFSMIKEEKLFNDIKFFFKKNKNINLEYNDEFKCTPIFILGMPRSGTSLIEQILSAHSKIHGAGELNYLEKIIYKVGIDQPKDINNYFLQIRKNYLSQIENLSDKPLIIDKLPLNFRWIGFIIKSLPEAKIIHVERNPMAVCWSNYKNFFVDSGMDFNLSQQNMSKYFSIYSNLMKFWKEFFMENFISIKYEDFVNDFESGTISILKYLNLQWENQVRDYHKVMRPVKTASYQQVREKIKKKTSDEWRIYQTYLEPMQKSLKSYNIEY